MRPISIVILAAGKSKRMCSNKSKVLFPLAGVPILERIVTTTRQLNPATVTVVYGHEGEQVQASLSHLDVNWVRQVELLGTGHALLQALPLIAPEHRVLVLVGDVPLIHANSLQRLLDVTPEDGIGLLCADVNDPTGLGRIIRNANHTVQAIIEEKDATPAQRQITEINTGIMLAPAEAFQRWLPQLKTSNAQGEYYLTDCIELAVAEQQAVYSTQPDELIEVCGINDRKQLANLERIYQRRLADDLLNSGVTLIDPNRVDIRGQLAVGYDSVIDINVIFEGEVSIGENCHIGANTIIRNSVIGNHVVIQPHSIIDGALIAEQCCIGPFARLRPGTVLADSVKLGNFVETKNASFGAESKASHLSYIGDSEVGYAVNIGAGTITCNYDGANKFTTRIEDGAFIGSNTALVAPVTIHQNATIAAGSTISKDAPANQLTIARAKQTTLTHWKKPTKSVLTD